MDQFPKNETPHGDAFTGNIRLMAVNDLVMFPRVMQPLHVYEPGYCRLVEDAIQTDRFIAIATLSESSDDQEFSLYEEVEPHACLCRIVAYHRTEDHHFNLLLAGLSRIHLIRPAKSDKPYTVMQARLRHDDSSGCSGTKMQEYSELISSAVMKAMSDMPEANEYLQQLLAFDLPLGMLTDIAGFILDLEKDVKLRLLAETDVITRAATLLNILHHKYEPPWLAALGVPTVPPADSMN